MKRSAILGLSLFQRSILFQSKLIIQEIKSRPCNSLTASRFIKFSLNNKIHPLLRNYLLNLSLDYHFSCFSCSSFVSGSKPFSIRFLNCSNVLFRSKCRILKYHVEVSLFIKKRTIFYHCDGQPLTNFRLKSTHSFGSFSASLFRLKFGAYLSRHSQ